MLIALVLYRRYSVRAAAACALGDDVALWYHAISQQLNLSDDNNERLLAAAQMHIAAQPKQQLAGQRGACGQDRRAQHGRTDRAPSSGFMTDSDDSTDADLEAVCESGPSHRFDAAAQHSQHNLPCPQHASAVLPDQTINDVLRDEATDDVLADQAADDVLPDQATLEAPAELTHAQHRLIEQISEGGADSAQAHPANPSGLEQDRVQHAARQKSGLAPDLECEQQDTSLLLAGDQQPSATQQPGTFQQHNSAWQPEDESQQIHQQSNSGQQLEQILNVNQDLHVHKQLETEQKRHTESVTGTSKQAKLNLQRSCLKICTNLQVRDTHMCCLLSLQFGCLEFAF